MIFSDRDPAESFGSGSPGSTTLLCTNSQRGCENDHIAAQNGGGGVGVGKVF
jgi:hypothetical protein